MILIPGRIPIAIHPFFWIFAALIGWLNSASLFGTLIWVGIILVSVVVHEFGHALTAVAFGQRARIQLVALGGLTSYEGPKLKFWKQFIIVFNGPLAGFGLFLLATLLRNFITVQPYFGIVVTIQIVNLFWSIVNLVPVLPLDGGQLLRIALEGFFGVKGFKASLLVGMIVAVLLSFYFFLIQAFLIGALFFLFAYQSFDYWRKSRYAQAADRTEEYKDLLLRGEKMLQAGDKSEATHLFEQIREKAGQGMLAATASQYLAFLYTEQGKKKEAYDLLLPLKSQLSEDSLFLLHQLAGEMKNPQLVAELSAEAYQWAPNRDTALRNARAFAMLKKPEPAGGWLQTAWQHGGFDLTQLLQEDVFSAVKNDPIFHQFVDHLK